MKEVDEAIFDPGGHLFLHSDWGHGHNLKICEHRELTYRLAGCVLNQSFLKRTTCKDCLVIVDKLLEDDVLKIK